MKHTVTLRNGVQVPALGLGTWFLGENKAARAREMESLRTGISAGMTLIDTAEMYGNGKAESLIKEVISDKNGMIFFWYLSSAKQCGETPTGTGAR